MSDYITIFIVLLGIVFLINQADDADGGYTTKLLAGIAVLVGLGLVVYGLLQYV